MNNHKLKTTAVPVITPTLQIEFGVVSAYESFVKRNARNHAIDIGASVKPAPPCPPTLLDFIGLFVIIVFGIWAFCYLLV